MSGTTIPPTVYTGMNAVTDGFKVVAELDTTINTGVITFNGRNGTVVLNNVDIQNALGFVPAGLASPNFSGVPTAPTAGSGTNTMQLATTAFVQDAITSIGIGVSSFNGRTGTVALTNTDVVGALGYTPANTLSPNLTGTPTAPTAASGTNTTQIATTAFVQSAVSGGIAGVSSFNTRTGAVTLLAADVVGALTYTPASLNSPTFIGTPTAPTPTSGDNSNKIATTAFVQNASVSSFNGRVGAITFQGSDIAGATAAGAVGSYAWAVPSNGTTINFGSTIAGSNLYINSSSGPLVQSGTWRCMGYSFYDSGSGLNDATLFFRIS